MSFVLIYRKNTTIMDIIKFENFGNDQINEGDSYRPLTPAEYEKVKKLPRVEDMEGEELKKLVGATVHPVIKPKTNINQNAAAAAAAAWKYMGGKDNDPKLLLKDKAGKPLCIII
jgi:hypothetical protein